MRVNIDEIKEGGLDRAWDFSRGDLDEILSGDPAGYKARSAAHVAAHLERMGERVILQGKGRADLDAPCGRCLASVTVEVPVDFTLTFVPEEPSEDEGEGGEDRGRSRTAGSFDPAAVGEETYSGHVIDLDPVTREQILLALPQYPLCREGCKGLCAVCGQNLNERECGCDRHVPDPRWAGLEKFRSKTSKSK